MPESYEVLQLNGNCQSRMLFQRRWMV